MTTEVERDHMPEDNIRYKFVGLTRMHETTLVGIFEIWYRDPVDNSLISIYLDDRDAVVVQIDTDHGYAIDYPLDDIWEPGEVANPTDEICEVVLTRILTRMWRKYMLTVAKDTVQETFVLNPDIIFREFIRILT